MFTQFDKGCSDGAKRTKTCCSRPKQENGSAFSKIFAMGDSKEMGRKSHRLGDLSMGQTCACLSNRGKVLVETDILKTAASGWHRNLAPTFRSRGGIKSGPAAFLDFSRNKRRRTLSCDTEKFHSSSDTGQRSASLSLLKLQQTLAERFRKRNWSSPFSQRRRCHGSIEQEPRCDFTTFHRPRGDFDCFSDKMRFAFLISTLIFAPYCL